MSALSPGRFLPPSQLIAALVRQRGPMDRNTETGGLLASGREPMFERQGAVRGSVTGAPVTNHPATGSPVQGVGSIQLNEEEQQPAITNAGAVAAGTAQPMYAGAPTLARYVPGPGPGGPQFEGRNPGGPMQTDPALLRSRLSSLLALAGLFGR